MLRVSRWMMRGLLFCAYPMCYYAWVIQMKDTWIYNDIISKHSDILYPQDGRWTSKNGVDEETIRREFKEALIMSAQEGRVEEGKELV